MPHDINTNYRTRLHNSKTNEEKFSLPPGFEPWSHGSIARVLSMSYGDPHEQQTLEDWKFFKVYFNQFLISIKIFKLNCILIQSIISLWPLIAEDEPRWYEPILWIGSPCNNFDFQASIVSRNKRLFYFVKSIISCSFNVKVESTSL